MVSKSQDNEARDVIEPVFRMNGVIPNEVRNLTTDLVALKNVPANRVTRIIQRRIMNLAVKFQPLLRNDIIFQLQEG